MAACAAKYRQIKRRMIVKKALADALEQRGYTTLTQVQEAVTNLEFSGADLLVSAQTGSGKTVGFGLAIAPTLLGEAEVFGQAGSPLALVIAPTRELALQVGRELGWLYAKAGVVVASCVGGMDMRDERRALSRGAHIVVATPGRLRDHVMRGSIDFRHLRAVVLDEADEMLDLGFKEDLEFILGETPEDRRTLMFSATVPRSIANLAKKYQKDAVRVSTKEENTQHTDIEYRAMNVAQHDAENAIINVLRFYESPNALVFCNTRDMVSRLTTRLSNRGFSVVSLSGELSQNERTHALQSMRDGRARVCVATDVAARGIDLPKLDLVVHADLPSNFETMLHRSGRTGRAGRKGVSTLIVPPRARRKCERILQSAKVKASWGDAPSAQDVNAMDQERMLADPMWEKPPTESEADVVQALSTRFSPEQLAAAFIRLYHDRHSAPEELSAPGADSGKSPRDAFGPSVWFSIEGGSKAGAEPRRILPMTCKAGDLGKNAIGAIRVQADQSFVEIKKDAVAGFLKALGSNMRIEGAKVAQLDKPPTSAPKQWDKPAKRRDTKPVDYNDDPKPRFKKPKKQEAARPREAEVSLPEGVHVPYKKRSKPAGSKPKHVTPVGKPNSKKNKARAKAAREAAKK